MKRKKGDLLLSWQKKLVGLYLGDYSYYNFEHSTVFSYGQAVIRKKAFKALFYTEDSLEGANLACADLRSADLTGANLRDANLYCADLIGANLRNADLFRANLRGTNLFRANLRGTNLKDIKYDENTVWPKGFKP